MTGNSFEIDRSACIGCGLCANECPDVYAMDEFSLATVKHEPSESEAACAVTAANDCPTNAIIVH
ncbi:MAG: ferredoxin [Oscillospiraceae bacterium]